MKITSVENPDSILCSLSYNQESKNLILFGAEQNELREYGFLIQNTLSAAIKKNWQPIEEMQSDTEAKIAVGPIEEKEIIILKQKLLMVAQLLLID